MKPYVKSIVEALDNDIIDEIITCNKSDLTNENRFIIYNKLYKERYKIVFSTIHYFKMNCFKIMSIVNAPYTIQNISIRYFNDLQKLYQQIGKLICIILSYITIPVFLHNDNKVNLFIEDANNSIIDRLLETHHLNINHQFTCPSNILPIYYTLNDYIIISLSALEDKRRLTTETIIELLNYLIDNFSYDILLIGGNDVSIFAKQICQDLHNQDKIINLVNSDYMDKYTMSFLSIIQNALLYIGYDTGLTHLSCTLGTPTICVCPGNIEAYIRWQPWPRRYLRSYLYCINANGEICRDTVKEIKFEHLKVYIDQYLKKDRYQPYHDEVNIKHENNNSLSVFLYRLSEDMLFTKLNSNKMINNTYQDIDILVKDILQNIDIVTNNENEILMKKICNNNVLLQICMSYVSQDYDKFITIYLNYMKQNKLQNTYGEFICHFLFKRKQYDLCCKVCQEIISVDHTNVHAHLVMSYCYKVFKNYRKALEEGIYALHLNHNLLIEKSGGDHVADVLRLNKQYDETKKLCYNILKQKPSPIVANKVYIILARMFWTLKDIHLYIVYANKACNLDINNKDFIIVYLERLVQLKQFTLVQYIASKILHNTKDIEYHQQIQTIVEQCHPI